MPRLNLMTWEPTPRRWRKIYRGETYTISCTQLGVPDTKEASYRAANDWWTSKRAEIDGQPRPHSEPKLLAELARRRDWARANDQDDLADEYDRRIAISDRTDSPSLLLLPPNVDDRLAGLKAIGVKLPERADSHTVHAILGEGRIWDERLRKSQPAIPEDRTVRFHVEKYLAYQLVRQRAEQISVSDYDQTRQAVEAFRTWMGPDARVEAIDADKWQSWYESLLESKLGKDTKRNRVRRPREFLAWLGEKGVFAIPGNLHARKFRFKGAKKTIVKFTDDEVRKIVAASSGQLKLHVMLALNCAFYPVDISDLSHDELDLWAGRIIRRRSKTRERESVPLVNYPLWTTTIDLLRRYRTEGGDRVLLTETGLPWVRDNLDEGGKRHRTNAVQSNYSHVKKRLKLVKPFMSLRATGGSKLEEHDDYGRYAQHFLGQAPEDIARKHYVTPSQDRFDAAVRWLGERFGF